MLHELWKRPRTGEDASLGHAPLQSLKLRSHMAGIGCGFVHEKINFASEGANHFRRVSLPDLSPLMSEPSINGAPLKRVNLDSKVVTRVAFNRIAAQDLSRI